MILGLERSAFLGRAHLHQAFVDHGVAHLGRALDFGQRRLLRLHDADALVEHQLGEDRAAHAETVGRAGFHGALGIA